MSQRLAIFMIFFYGSILVNAPARCESIAMAEQIFTTNSPSSQAEKCRKSSRKTQAKDCAKNPVKKGTKSNRPKLKTLPKPPETPNDRLPEKDGDRF
jgi:hypothetical protein